MRKWSLPERSSDSPERPFAHDHEGGAGRREALGRLVGARSGDKGGNANVGVWVPEMVEQPRRDRAYGWLAGWLTPDRVRALIPEAADLEVEVHPLPNLHALNVVLHGFLGRGVAANDLLDPQAKGLGERLRARVVEIPSDLLGDATGGEEPQDVRPPGGPPADLA